MNIRPAAPDDAQGSTATIPVRIYLLILDGDFGAAMASILLRLSGVAIDIDFRFLGRNEQALL
ncbi:hypothetical protein [Neorhizobium galegae]|uniref:hypothetical protein n=1 Tax=Neorhizobium galegae TaxID=399 RepID=UPI0006211FE0|nr:hypothetical protein [Neorhizobium galegae]CDZ63496.1 Hypothetical protein NGAL_HAMBI2566_55970 [Neorhizobium galegae bv. orientalis]KAB1120494.1 hypothetical protein F4V90_29735 [Neorhizobium galegae]MCQ1575253.1 hypothetical protein [Neorhizobium galegae]MCQ1809093.1 hypothetical protein [Neorhizobium galegae]MCQ1839284.1 hypothetical protein [Neorhizobium galegae]